MGLPQPYFRAQSTPTGPIARGRAVYVNLSRSPDLRILSHHTAFSGIIPMTDFRLVCGLRAYSGGTVPDFHRIHYSPLSLRQYQRHSNLYSVYPLSAAALRSTRAVLRPGHLSGRRCERREFYCFRLTPHSKPEKHKKCASCQHETQRKRPHRKTQ